MEPTVHRKTSALNTSRQSTLESGLLRHGSKNAEAEEKKDALLRQMVQERKEDEVKFADMECRLREFILEVVSPTIIRNTKLLTETEILRQEMQSQGAKLQTIYDSMTTLQERSDVVVSFQGRLDSFAQQSHALEEKLVDYKRITLARIEKAEQAVELHKSVATRLSRSLDRVMQDMDGFTQNIRALQEAVDVCGQKSREHIELEIRRVDLSLQEVKDLHQTFANEVWGPEEPQEISPPSLRRLDMQMRKARADLTQALADLLDLRRLDGEMSDVKQKLEAVGKSIEDLSGKSSDLKKRIDKIALDTKNDNKRVSNLMAAFTANLMQDVRVGFSHEVTSLQESQQEIQKFVRETQATVAELESAVSSTARQVEAALRECQTDIDNIDNRRKKDKQGLEEGLSHVQGRVNAALEASEATLKGLEHVSSVMNMSLQSERMSVALDTTDFADRKDTPCVGAHCLPDKRKSGSNSRKGGLDPEILFRLTYQPTPVPFQGASFERQQLLALREKLVHTAQEVLSRGPAGASSKVRKALPGDLDSPSKAPSALEALSAELPSGRHSVPLVPRPGSRGQPSARGSPLLGDQLFGGSEAVHPAGPAGGGGKDSTESTGAGLGAAAMRLPALPGGEGRREKELVQMARRPSTTPGASLTAR